MEHERKKINYKQLIAHENNHYSLDGLDELADSILEVGLLEDIIVKPISKCDKSGNPLYVIVSGHRRASAIKKLVEKRGLESYENIPCIVLPEEEDDIITEMKLHIANITTREMTEYDKMIAIERMNNLLQQAKENGHEIKGRRKEIIAFNIGLSPSQVQTYMTVANHSDKDVKEAIRKGKLTIEAVHELIKANKKNESSNKLTMAQVKELPVKTPRQKIYKKILNLEKAVERNASEIENYEEILQMLKEIERKIET